MLFALRLAFLTATILTVCAVASAQGTCVVCSSVTSSVTLTANVETAVKLNITAGSGGATIVDGGSGAYSVSFGSVNGLGSGSPSTGVSVSTSGSGATYTTPITVTPVFSGFANTTATVSVYQDSTTSSNSQSAAREGSAAGSVASVPTSQGSASVVTASAASASGLTRYVGLFVSNANGGSAVTGTLSPKFIYSITVN